MIARVSGSRQQAQMRRPSGSRECWRSAALPFPASVALVRHCRDDGAIGVQVPLYNFALEVGWVVQFSGI